MRTKYFPPVLLDGGKGMIRFLLVPPRWDGSPPIEIENALWFLIWRTAFVSHPKEGQTSLLSIWMGKMTITPLFFAQFRMTTLRIIIWAEVVTNFQILMSVCGLGCVLKIML